MINLTHWISPAAMRSLAWSLLHFLWQGTALAALAAILTAFCRRASARYVIAVAALVLMLLAPIGTFFWLIPSAGSESHVISPTVQVQSITHRSFAQRASASAYKLSPSFDTLPWLVEIWLAGVAFFSLRFAGGFLLLEHERRKQSGAVSAGVLAACEAIQRKLHLERAIRYCECKWLEAPAVIGWFRPVVLLPAAALMGLSEEQLQSIIAHELAHIQRCDAFVNAFQIAVETLLFYHPAVWWMNKRIRAEREHCCDDVAVSLCGNRVEYARALTMMEAWRSAPVLAMAANRGPLSQRILRVLGMSAPAGARSRGLGITGGLVCLTAALLAGNALFAVAHPKPARAAQISLARLHWAPAAVLPQATATGAPAPASKPSPARPAPAAEPASKGSYIDEMKSAGLSNLTVDQLIAMKIHGIDADYVQGMKQAGVGLDPDQLVAMKIHGATPEYVRGLREQGLQPNADDIVSMRIHEVTPEYIRDIRALGLNPAADEFVSMRIHDVTPDFIKALQTAGYKVDVDDAVRAKIQGITPDFLERVRQHGFKDLDLDKLIHLKQTGILGTRADL
jgi:beta-lactamase regulating signal transducer with metallopeptidase domain